MRSRMPGRQHRPSAASIYWDSVDSSAGSNSSSGCSAAGSRNYVDPWDLENYAYLRRHSIAAVLTAPQPPRPAYNEGGGGTAAAARAGYSSRLSSSTSRHSPDESDYWYASAIREPGYDAPASVEEIYFRPPRPLSTSCYYHQPIYEDEMSQYAASGHLYAHLSELEQAEALEEIRTRELLKQRKLSKSRNYYQGDECFYRQHPSEMLMTEAPTGPRGADELLMDEVEAIGYRSSPRPSHITLNTYGHLKIDYTNSWNSLHRKILSK